MNTPICDFIARNRKKEHRFYMPGHKGKGMVERDDITEIDGADVLYRPDGIIAESEKNAALIFGSAKTVYSCEGSSLGIRAVMYLLKTYATSVGKDPVIFAARNVHSSFLSACGLNDLSPEWLYGEGGNAISVHVTPEEIDLALSAKRAVAVYVTSPDYLGYRCDVEGIAKVCKKHGALLVADNAHGAYLRFTDPILHPLALGADICIESAHKTLPCFTGTAYVHVAPSAPSFFCDNLNFAMYLFASTSPSYLLLSSLDRFNGTAESFTEEVRRTAKRIEETKARLRGKGFTLYGDEPLKMTIDCLKYGYKGTEVATYLRKRKIETEYADRAFIVFLFSPCNGEDSISLLEKNLLSLTRKKAIDEIPPAPVRCERVTTVREALFAPWEEIPVGEAEGRVLSGLVLSCPPAVPVAVCGERLSRGATAALTYSGYRTVKVLVGK